LTFLLPLYRGCRVSVLGLVCGRLGAAALRVSGVGWRLVDAVLSDPVSGGRGGGCSALVGAHASAGVAALQSLRRLWVAVISRHSERAAASPRRWKRSILRLCLVSPKTGSIIVMRRL
jgi:hypothetical protein